MSEPSTAFVLEQIQNSNNAKSGMKYIKENVEIKKDINLSEYLNQYLFNHQNLKQSDIIRDSGLARTYAYEIFNGKKNASRDKVIAICFAANMSLDETNHALTYSGNGQLYAKNNRDACIILAITLKSKGNKDLVTVMNLNDFLDNNNYAPLDI